MTSFIRDLYRPAILRLTLIAVLLWPALHGCALCQKFRQPPAKTPPFPEVPLETTDSVSQMTNQESVLRGADPASLPPTIDAPVEIRTEKPVIQPYAPPVSPTADEAALRARIEELERKITSLESEVVGRDITIRSLQQQPPTTHMLEKPVTPMSIPIITVPGVEVRQVGQSVRIAIPESMIFEPGSIDKIQSSGEELLLKMVSELKTNYPDNVIIIEGHTDSMVIDPRNPSHLLEFSAYQAKVVAKHLASAVRIDPAQLRIVGCGANDPIAENTTEEGRARNRRIELVVTRE